MKTFPEFRVVDVRTVKNGRVYFEIVLYHSMYCCDVIDAYVPAREITLNTNLNNSLDVQEDRWIKIKCYLLLSDEAVVTRQSDVEGLMVGSEFKLTEDQIDKLNKLLKWKALSKFERELEERETRVAENIVDNLEEEI